MRWALSWILYALGDLVSRLPGPGYEYPIYNKLMVWSSHIQIGDNGPWGDPKPSATQTEAEPAEAYGDSGEGGYDPLA